MQPAHTPVTLTAQTSRVNSQISTPRLTPLRMIERNRNTDKDDISRLENKIKALESDITIAKQQGEERRLDKLEQSLTNTSIPALNDNSLLDDEEIMALRDQKSPDKLQQNLLSKLMASGSNQKDDLMDDSCLHEDELAILGDYQGGASRAEKKPNTVKQSTCTTGKDPKDVIVEYDEYEKQLMRELSTMEAATVLKNDSLDELNAQKSAVLQNTNTSGSTDQTVDLKKAV